MTLTPATARLELPEAITDDGLLVGWSLEPEHRRNPIGFSYGSKAKAQAASNFLAPILMEREGHLMTIAPTGAGKGTACIVPALLRFPGPVIAIDPKGENAMITARRRRELGHKVAVIDPMGITGFDKAGLNPLDIIDPDSPTLVDDAMSLIAAMAPNDHGSDTSDGRYWQERGATFVLGVMLHVLTDLPPARRNLLTVRDLVNQAVGELSLYTAAAEQRAGAMNLGGTVLAALEASRNEEAQSIGRMLRIGALTTLGGILSFSQSLTDVVRSGALADSIRQTTFNLEDVVRGDPLSIFIVMPPHMLDSHGRVLRLWVHTLMTLISSRSAAPEHSTLFILDEAAQLGAFDALRRSITLMRGYGLQTWSFWQDPSQLKRLYPNDWQTMINNCRSVQCFGANTMLAARAMAEIVGYEPAGQLLDLEDNEMLLQLSGDLPVLARLPNYRADPAFAGLFDPNPLHDASRLAQKPASRPVTRLYYRPEPGDPDGPPETPADIIHRLKQRT